ncbi:MAG: DUF6377 domain-containing protein [Candidatus Pseudobacter hemicellulosilyticus]|uniref:DUF6377 domain-containing protein n=1 Tax=Candidatus Pseudobacter hemicellulosilyticus TaxID=3121375 RepID=A0AAJ5X0C3_9BACT|nr:MAG: DUF6377 domain-containing protein [Pseudobacter sp.]
MNKFFLIALLGIGSSTGFGQVSKTDSLLRVLQTEIVRKEVYVQEREKRINQLRLALFLVDSSNFNGLFTLQSRIFDEYSAYKFDSAFAYARKMGELSEKFHKPEQLIWSKILVGNSFLHSGFYKEGFDIINKIDTNQLSKALKTHYLLLRARLNAGIGAYDNDGHFSKSYEQQSDRDFKDAAISSPPNDFDKTIDLAFLPDAQKAPHHTPEFFYKVIIDAQLPEHSIAMVATRISFAFEDEDRILFLALAAINDIRSSTKETLAIYLLGQELFKQGKTNDAYACLQEAAENARFYGARHRSAQIESLLPLVSGKLLDEQQHRTDQLLIGFLTFLIVAVILFFLLIIYRKQILRIKASETLIKEKNSELESVNKKLWESSKIKEELIGLFLKTCSSYIESLGKVKRETLHYIKLGKYKEVSQLLNNIPVAEEKGNLYNMLDTAFLKMFPNFIASFNALLKKEDQVWPKSGETLNATLRIFALMRLGITEQEAIAKILDYSVSTVYTYKMRIKSRALVGANEFEQKIMEIKFTDNG